MLIIRFIGKLFFLNKGDFNGQEKTGFIIYSITILFIEFSFVKPNDTYYFAECLRGICRDRQWIVENAPEVRLARKKAKAKAMAYWENNYNDRIKWRDKSLDSCNERNQKLERENYRLKVALETITKMKNGQAVSDE